MKIDSPRILYIAGYSRCGSTIMDMLLSASKDAISTGELTYLLDDAANPKRICTCGAPYMSCKNFSAWVGTRPKAEADLIRRIESRSGLRTLMDGKVPTGESEAYRTYATSLFAHLQEVSGANVIVDSSKTAKDATGRPLALWRLAGLDVRVLHLTRDPRATIRSYLDKGSNWVLEGHRSTKPLESWRPILGWSLANRLARQIGREVGENRYLHIRLEDVLQNPETMLEQIGTFAGIDMTNVANRVVAGAPFLADHNVGGNRARLKPQKIDLTRPSVVRLPLGHDLGLRLLGGKLARQLGYA